MKMYLSNRIAKVEGTAAFQAALAVAQNRQASAFAATRTRADNMAERMYNAKLKIVKGWTYDQIYQLAIRTHGGNYEGDPGEFVWDNRKAQAVIRPNLTNYEALWQLCNRGETGREAYEILRQRIDDLIDEAYPQFAGSPEILPPPRSKDPARTRRVNNVNNHRIFPVPRPHHQLHNRSEHRL
jgi:hypothetical protein